MKPALWITAVASVPLAVLLIGGTLFVSRQRSAAHELQQHVRVNRISDAGMAERFRERAFTEGTAVWSKIDLLCRGHQWGTSSKLPIIGTGEEPTDLDPATQWNDSPLVSEYLQEMQPVIELIHESCDVPKPVWQPVNFRGVQTLLPHLQNSRSIARLLQLEAIYAIYDGQTERALRAIRSLKSTAEVYDWRLCIVGELVHLALRSTFERTVALSLTADVWTEEQVAELMRLVEQPMPVDEAWMDALREEESMMVSEVTMHISRPIATVTFPTTKLALIQQYDRLQSLADSPLGELSKRARAQTEATLANTQLSQSWMNPFLPAFETFAAALENAEYSRRLTLTALAIKRFQLVHGSWPEELEDLSDVGLADKDWSLPRFGKFGYAVADGEATVFMYSRNQPADAPALPATIRKAPEFSYDTILIH